MNLSMYQKEVLQNYKSNSQIARVLTENWFVQNMYCPCCLNEKVNDYPNNKKAKDFFCEKCKNDFQLKSSKTKFARKVNDGAYNTMISVVQNNASPNFLLLHYSNDWSVKNLSLIPKFFVNVSMIERKKITYPKGRKNGWVGCNFLLTRLPEEGKINLIKDEKMIEKTIVNKIWKKMFFINNKKPEFRGWTSDVLKCVEDLNNKFSLNEIYKSEKYLKELHPHNNNIQAKIRQQLQILRNNKVLKFLGDGRYEFLK